MHHVFKPVGAVLLSCSLVVPSSLLAQNNELAAENFKQADANGDGNLVYAEFVKFIDLNAADDIGKAAKVSSRGLHAKAFERVDADANGVVTPQELQKLSR
ncbi:MAG: hypothetical protein AAF382_07715 [Pseudomonadota bacterium]